MAADLAALRTYLRDAIGLGSTNEVGLARTNAIIDEGLESIADFVDLSHEKGVKTLCNNVRKPSGLIPQPNWVEPDPNPQNLQAPMVPRAGQSIPTICEQRMIVAAYGAKIYSSIGRTITTASLNRDRLREFQRHREMIENHREPESLPELSKSFTVQKFLDQLPTYLREMLGVNKVSLAYVIREESIIPVSLPALQQNKPWGRENDDLMNELIAYTPHSGPAYQADNARVYNLLVNALAGTSALASTTRHQNKRDGRGAYLDLVLHHLSTAKWEKSVAAAEKLLAERKWNGKNARYPLKIHIAKQREAFNDLSRAQAQIDYMPPNETSRVRYLLQSIETNDPTICAAKTTIKADANMKNNFELAADFLIVTAPASKFHNNNQNHNVSAMNSSSNNNNRKNSNRNSNKRKGSKRGRVDVGPKTGVELRYYQRGEWNRLTQAQRDECVEIRQKRKAGGKLNNSNDEPQTKIAALETQIKEMKEHFISVMSSSNNGTRAPLPPKPSSSNNAPSALRPPARFSQTE